MKLPQAPQHQPAHDPKGRPSLRQGQHAQPQEHRVQTAPQERGHDEGLAVVLANLEERRQADGGVPPKYLVVCCKRLQSLNLFIPRRVLHDDASSPLNGSTSVLGNIEHRPRHSLAEGATKSVSAQGRQALESEAILLDEAREGPRVAELCHELHQSHADQLEDQVHVSKLQFQDLLGAQVLGEVSKKSICLVQQVDLLRRGIPVYTHEVPQVHTQCFEQAQDVIECGAAIVNRGCNISGLPTIQKKVSQELVRSLF
mmetsp:Transcript_105543/g.274744  ORF Transcript_105543/g.274744 Transcript_105543/m.274744 type:complete len:257 (+) Transcript_105543:296-1066(+)